MAEIKIYSKNVTSGFTLVEVIIAVAIIGILAAIATPMYSDYINRVKVQAACIEIQMLEKEIIGFRESAGRFPIDLAEIGLDTLLDPWGNPYRYLPVQGNPPGMLRKDLFMVPVNSDFDLYSTGQDGQTATPFVVPVSKDDIVRANDGQYLGLASNY